MTDPTSEADFACYDFAAVRPTLRRDLDVRVRHFGGRPSYVLEDAARSRFFRLGPAEYAVASLLDGRTSVADAVAAAAAACGEEALAETDAAAFCQWLVENDLARTPQSGSAARLREAADADRRRAARERSNPLMLKVPLGCPDGVMRAAAAALGWLAGPAGAALWLAAVAAAAWSVLTAGGPWDRVADVTDAGNWLRLGLTAAALKVVHEFAHGVACRRLGGEVREWGVLLLLFVPLPYVDVTSSWRFPSKWDRVRVAAAGMLVETFLAAVALAGACFARSPETQFLLMNVALTAGVVTVLFNANPLMRFDGYYVLSDVLELPNLATHGQQAVRSWWGRVVLGKRSGRPTWPEGRGGVVAAYGVAAWCWRVVICVSLTALAAALFHGAGLVLAAASLAAWLLVPAAKGAWGLLRPDPMNPPRRLRLAAIIAAAAGIGWLTLTQATWRTTVSLPAVCEPETLTAVRAAADGRVDRVHVAAGQTVLPGQLLFELRNDELAVRSETLRLDAASARLRADRLLHDGQIAAAAAERDAEAASREQLAEVRSRLDALRVFAPVGGRVLTSSLAAWEGRWVRGGTQLLELSGDGAAAATVLVAVPQSDADAVRQALGRPVAVTVWGDAVPRPGRLVGVEPRVRTSLPTPRLTALAGGPLAVVPGETREDWRLTRPHFVGRVELSAGAAAPRVGRTGVARVTVRTRPLGDALWAAARDFWDDQCRVR